VKKKIKVTSFEKLIGFKKKFSPRHFKVPKVPKWSFLGVKPLITSYLYLGTLKFQSAQKCPQCAQCAQKCPSTYHADINNLLLKTIDIIITIVLVNVLLLHLE